MADVRWIDGDRAASARWPGCWLTLAACRGVQPSGRQPPRRRRRRRRRRCCPADAKPANLDFTLKDVDGKDVTLADYKGKVILLDFWATWCGPCKVEIPGSSSSRSKYGKDGLQVVGVSVDDTADKLKPYVDEMKMNYPVLQGLGHDDVQDAFGPMFGIPVDGRHLARRQDLREAHRASPARRRSRARSRRCCSTADAIRCALGRAVI